MPENAEPLSEQRIAYLEGLVSQAKTAAALFFIFPPYISLSLVNDSHSHSSSQRLGKNEGLEVLAMPRMATKAETFDLHKDHKRVQRRLKASG